MFAHYVATKNEKFVIIAETNRPIGQKIVVAGKVEARKVALQNNAKPWNF